MCDVRVNWKFSCRAPKSRVMLKRILRMFLFVLLIARQLRPWQKNPLDPSSQTETLPFQRKKADLVTHIGS